MIQSWTEDEVPSISNPADAPSRGESAQFLAQATENEVKVGWGGSDALREVRSLRFF